MSEAERAEALKAIQLELFDLNKRYGAIVAEFKSRRRELARREKLIRSNGQKECRKCREEMDVEQFYIDTRYADDRYPYCIECKLAMVRKRARERKAA